MSRPPNLLNDDGHASMATAIMMSHHAFRRDLAWFAVALKKIAEGDTSRMDAVREEWQRYRGALHGHHQVEDSAIFPDLRSQRASLEPTLDRLSAHHRSIDPMLEDGDRAFGELPKSDTATKIVAELRALLDEHLALEEAEVIPFLRGAREFPAPPDEAAAAMYADGFAWASHGIAPDVLERVSEMLPEILSSRLPDARAKFEERCERVWGSAKAGAARTSIPEL